MAPTKERRIYHLLVTAKAGDHPPERIQVRADTISLHAGGATLKRDGSCTVAEIKGQLVAWWLEDEEGVT